MGARLRSPMSIESCPPIKVTFEQPVNGYWDGGKKDGGSFEPSFHFETDPEKSYVKWSCIELNHWFNLPMHFETGKRKSQRRSDKELRSQAIRQLRHSLANQEATVE